MVISGFRFKIITRTLASSKHYNIRRGASSASRDSSCTACVRAFVCGCGCGCVGVCACASLCDSYSVRRRDDLCPRAGRRVGFHEKQGLTRKSRRWLHRRHWGLRRRSFCFCPLPINTTRTRQNHVSKRRRFCPRRRVRPTE